MCFSSLSARPQAPLKLTANFLSSHTGCGPDPADLQYMSIQHVELKTARARRV